MSTADNKQLMERIYAALAKDDMVTKEGTRYDNEYCMVYRFENGKIVEFREYCDSVLTETVLGKYPAQQAA